MYFGFRYICMNSGILNTIPLYSNENPRYIYRH
jgi:hypothetical protein